MEANGKVVKNMLRSKTDKFAILHLKNTPELNRCHFWGTEQLKALGDYDKVMKLSNYELVYMADVDTFPELRAKDIDIMLELIFTKFNVDHPEDYKAHSLSVSDIVVMHVNGNNGVYYVDSFGFTEITEFLDELMAE